MNHLSDEELRQYWQRKMPSSVLLAADDHIAGCSECRRSLERIEETASHDADLWRALIGSDLPAAYHLSHEELIAFVESNWKTADRERVTEHVKNCAECRTDVEDLRSVRADAAVPHVSRPIATAGIKRRFRWSIPAWAGAVALILLGIVLGLRLGHRPSGPQSNPLVQLNDAGGTIRLDSIGQLQTPSRLEASDAAKLKDALLRRRIEPAAVLAQLSSPPGKLLGGPSTPPRSLLVAPLGVVVVSDQPVFHWRSFGSDRYVISVFDARYHKVAESPLVMQTEWKPDHPLSRGEIYTWQLTAETKNGTIREPVPPEPEARFKVLAQIEADPLEKAQREHSDSHLLLGILYAQAGALDDAERELAALLAANPNSQIAKDLLASIQEVRHKP